MNLRPVSSIVIKIFPLLIVVAGCDAINASIPHVYGPDEVPPEVRAQPRQVPSLAPGVDDDMPWMRLGDVPSMPTNFTPQPLIDASRNQMATDRVNARADQQEYVDYGALMPPLPIPPPPALPSRPQP